MITPFLGVLLGAWKNWSTFSHLFNFLHDWWLFNCTICHEVWECRRPTWGNEKLSLCFYITHCFFFFFRRYNTLISLVSFCSQIYNTHTYVYIYIYIYISFQCFLSLGMSILSRPAPPRTTKCGGVRPRFFGPHF